jgi:hypothetical protein
LGDKGIDGEIILRGILTLLSTKQRERKDNRRAGQGESRHYISEGEKA